MNNFTKRPALTDKKRQQITGLLVNFIVKDIRPLAAVHGEGFREMLHFFEPGYTVPSYATLWATITHQYDTLRENIEKEMKGRTVSLTTDLWTSSTMEPYITVTVHYITDTWKLSAAYLYYARETYSCQHCPWGLLAFCTVHDNASMNLATELCELFPKDLGCTGHTLQLAIKAGLVLPDIAKAINAARRLVSHFRHSALATCALKKRQEQLGIKANTLQNDCPVRWNSNFDMLERLFEQRIPVQSVLADETVTKPSVQKSLAMRASQWELVEQLIPVLRPLAKATKASDLGAIRSFKNAVRRQLETRFKLESDGLAESIPIVASMLDPHFKHLQFIPESMREDACDHLNRLLRDEREPPAATGENEDAQADETVDDGAEPVMVKKNRLENDFEQLYGPHYESGRKACRYITAAEEARGYFLTPHIPTMENPLQWWAHNQDQFPRLAKLAQRYLAVPATSTPSERVFSLAGNTITRQQSILHPAHVDALIFLHANQERKAKTVNEDFDSQ
ncbi:E3 SUMO-protein ligase ZBED1-like [Centroberyx affinis]|uniref:E3 SUMO-protein ligase ZBED1-like n=1 Tax=Centroberyx affinis TaxID=166261 RepID=UPI003A5BC370